MSTEVKKSGHKWQVGDKIQFNFPNPKDDSKRLKGIIRDVYQICQVTLLEKVTRVQIRLPKDAKIEDLKGVHIADQQIQIQWRDGSLFTGPTKSNGKIIPCGTEFSKIDESNTLKSGDTTTIYVGNHQY